MPHLRSKNKKRERQEKGRQHSYHKQRIYNIILDSSYHDFETVFWTEGIPVITVRTKDLLGYVPPYAVDRDRCGEVLSPTMRENVLRYISAV